jgi:hypothetical protein
VGLAVGAPVPALQVSPAAMRTQVQALLASEIGAH